MRLTPSIRKWHLYLTYERAFLMNPRFALQARDGFEASHLCHYRGCAKPDHLQFESHATNSSCNTCQGVNVLGLRFSFLSFTFFISPSFPTWLIWAWAWVFASLSVLVLFCPNHPLFCVSTCDMYHNLSLQKNCCNSFSFADFLHFLGHN